MPIKLITVLAVFILSAASLFAQQSPLSEESKKDTKSETWVNANFNSVGGSIGTTFSAPLLAITVKGTYSPWRFSFFDLGMEMGFFMSSFLNIYDPIFFPSYEKTEEGFSAPNVSYFSLYPFAHYAFFLPFRSFGGWYIGGGIGLMIQFLNFSDVGRITGLNLTLDLSTGFIIWNRFTICFGFRTDFTNALLAKFAVGYIYRFKAKIEEGRSTTEE